MTSPPYFSPELFRFLRDLRRNNNRDWFSRNRQRWEEHVRDPFLAFIGDVGPHLRAISPYLVADPSPVGGSLFRIHRDTRFSRDKSPYKTWAAAQFRHRGESDDVHAPGFYLHLEPGEVFAGVGLWHPPAPEAHRIRQAILADPERWKMATRSRRFRAKWDLTGDSLKRPPRGLDPLHPLLADLKRKDFLGTCEFPAAQVAAPGFLERFVDACRRAAPFLDFLTRALGLPC
jgi:uncharacterized protein (TIGR02453 family)